MDWLVQIGIWASGAVIVVGVMQWAKGILPKTLPTWVYSLMLPIAAIGSGIAAGGDNNIFNGLGIWAVAQLGYEIIIQKVKQRLEK